LFATSGKILDRARGTSHRQIWLALALLEISFLVGANASARASDHGFGLPVDCKLGEDCFVQQMPDIDPSDQILDPLCGKATYQGHDGWDIRVRSLKDLSRSTSVVAVADGTVLRTRDGVPDRIYDHIHDTEPLTGKECGNGMVVEHAGGLVSQYCHLKEGSLVVRPGAYVKKGQPLGSIGSSGLAEFPHVHLSVRRDGRTVEPLTGRPLGAALEACGNTTESLFEPSAQKMLARSASAIMQIGLTNAAPESATLVRQGEPPQAKISGPLVAWVWAINVERGSQFRIRLIDPEGGTILNVETKPLEIRKASYVAYAGGKHVEKEGSYALKVDLLSSGSTIWSAARSIEIGR
jgi:hypothetical protein